MEVENQGYHRGCCVHDKKTRERHTHTHTHTHPVLLGMKLLGKRAKEGGWTSDRKSVRERRREIATAVSKPGFARANPQPLMRKKSSGTHQR